MKDEFKHKGQRLQLVNLLREKGINDENVLQAINQIPRHLFLNSAFENFAYQDKAFPIAAGQTISQPFTVATQSSLLELKKGEKVLEIGTGSGFQTAVLIAMGADVYTIERQKELFEFSQKMFKKIKLKPRYATYGDGYKGLPTFGPFDKILVTAGAENLPTKLLQQLKVGGKMIIPIGKEKQIMTIISRIDEKQYEQIQYGECQFVPMLESTATEEDNY